MLSFDITDRHIRIVKGSESHGKVRLNSATTIDLKEGVIVNGHVKDIPQMATIISDELKGRKMQDSEAVVSISSNLIIFRELHIPKAKGQQQLLTMVQNQMQHTMGVGDDYSISYTIAGEIEEDGTKALRILATACPFEVVKAFRKVFSMLSINLRSVAVACNTISRIVYSDKKMAMKMPLLLVQIDSNFLSLNLFENNTLVFSRFTSIDAADYDNADDYVFEAVNENIFRMIQFQRAQNSEEPIQNVVFYGETTEYIRLTKELEKQDITTSLLGIPASVGGYENFDFQNYANAIGAMFKSNRDIERINLLEIDASSGKAEAGASFAVGWIGSALLSALIIGGFYVFFMIRIDQMNGQIAEIDNWIASPETTSKITLVDEAKARADKIAKYNTEILTASDNYITKPKLTWEVVENILANETGPDNELDALVTGLAFVDGAWEIKCSSEDSYGPSRFIGNMIEQDIFREITYDGYERETAEAEAITAVDPDAPEISAGEPTYNFSVTFIQEPNLTPAEVKAAEEAAAAEAEAAEAAGGAGDTGTENADGGEVTA
ncbi:MAG: pilus assembly protein PilM [Ruminococcus sp.]|jgi:type IV pilus assembly protein PilM|nr:pilus assembly protein PilM [Ruminococcus sp.]